MVRTGKGLTTSLNIITKRSNKKQKSRFGITDINKQDLRKFLKKFKNSYYQGYNSKQVHNELTGDEFFLIKQITNLIKTKRHIWIRTKGIKSGVNKTIGHVNEKNQSEEL